MNARIEAIARKLNRVGSLMSDLKHDNEVLQGQKILLEQKLAERSAQVDLLTEENNRVKLAKTLVSTPGDKAEMKFKVNELVREIDKCIALLNR